VAVAAIGRVLLAPLVAPDDASTLPVWLLPHQAEAVRRARRVLARFGGVLIADGVGLGKTFIALALAALERQGGGDALAVVPAALREEWTRAMERTGVVVPITTHAALGRAPLQAAAATLLLADEAHAFRNPRTRRYDALARAATGRRVALLSATPFNNGPADVTALLALFAGRDRFRSLGVPDVADALSSGDGRAAQLALGAVSVCRTRRLVEQRWPDVAAAFPRRVLEPPCRYDLAAAYGGRLADVLGALEVLVRSMRDADHAAALVHLGLLRRLESSPAALAASLRRHRAFAEDAVAAARGGRRLTRREFGRAHRRSLPDDQLLFWELLLGDASGDGRAFEPLLAAVRELEAMVADVTARAADTKADALEDLLRRTRPPAIVFTEHRATALHLLRRLRRGHRVLAVTGPDAWAGAVRIPRVEALDAFAPIGRGRRSDPLLSADVLVATDVAGEGLNLQDARLVVNYDLPWNPVRVMQRVGRSDRLGSPHASVHVATLVPSRGIEVLTGTLRRLREKLDRGAHAPTAEPDPLAALWWLEQGLQPDAVDAEAWRRVTPFEAMERWHGLLDGHTEAPDPVVAGAVVTEGCAEVGVLLAVEWPGHAAVPLPYVMRSGNAVREDAVALTALAERARRGRPVTVEPAMLTDALATVLPLARARAATLHAAWRGSIAPAPGRRAALAILERAVLIAQRDRRDTGDLDDALTRLRHDLPAGAERMLVDLVRSGPTASELAAAVMRLADARADGVREPPPRPRLALAAALVVSVSCPGHD
jgi:superfamily II DNA or RNA helicase